MLLKGKTCACKVQTVRVIDEIRSTVGASASYHYRSGLGLRERKKQMTIPKTTLSMYCSPLVRVDGQSHCTILSTLKIRMLSTRKHASHVLFHQRAEQW